MKQVVKQMVLTALLVALTGSTIATVIGDAGDPVLSVDHFVAHASTAPAIKGEQVRLYVRERVLPGTLAPGRGLAGRVVLFVHGAGTPAEVAFDLPYQDYSWMAHLARAGFDVFAVDMTGYGRSTRPALMNDPCNLGPERQTPFVKAPCAATYRRSLTTIASDWDDLDAAVEYIRALRKVDRVHLVGWSLGGPRAGGYAARHPDKVDRLALLAPAYGRDLPDDAPAAGAGEGAPFSTQSRADFDANWTRQVGCADQRDARVGDEIWKEMLASDPVGATWGDGVRRAPQTTVWGWNRAAAAKTTAPTLIVHGTHDKQVAPERSKAFYDDLGSTAKVLIELGCASHNVMWEKHHALLYRASLDWLTDGRVKGTSHGILRLGF